MKRLIVLITVLTLATNLRAETIYVELGEDIQAALDQAAPWLGDTVVLRPGRHLITNELSITKGITLTGTAGYTNVVIDGCGLTRCLVLNHSEAKVDGLTITGGWTNNKSGAGVCCNKGAVVNCVIVSNTVSHDGDNYLGGGIYCSYLGMISNCVVTGNSAPYGGGIYCDKGGVVQDCIISNNIARYYGGGINTRGAITRSVIVENSAKKGAGAECSYGGLLDRCLILKNEASDSGGGAFILAASVQNCIVAENRANNGAGLCLDSNAQVKHCTVSRNTALDNSGGIKGSSKSVTFNTIVWSNDAPDSPDVGPAGTYNYCCARGLSLKAHNFAVNPNFVDLNGGNYHLTFMSPCIDAGSSAGGTAFDYEGAPRPIDGDGDGVPAFDMGAYEQSLDPAHPTVSVLISGAPRQESSVWPLDYGLHQMITGKVVVVAVPEIEETNGTRYVNTGWTGTGSIPEFGTDNLVVATVTNDSTLTWLWTQQQQLTLEASKGTITGTASGYWDEGTPFELQFNAPNGYAFHHWEIDGKYAGSGEPLVLVADGPHQVQARCESLTTITNVVTFDPTPWPGIDRNIYEWLEDDLIFTDKAGMGLDGYESSKRPSNGTAYLTPGSRYPGPSAWIRATCEGTIALLSADIAEYSTAYWEPTVSFIGHKSAGGTIINTFALDGQFDGPGGIVDFQHFNFTADFRDLVAVEIPLGGFALDNVRYVLTPLDGDRDGMDDAWEKKYFGNTMRNGRSDADDDGLTDLQEWIAGSDPTNLGSIFSITDFQMTAGALGVEVRWNSITNRLYSVWSSETLTGVWNTVFAGPGSDGSMSYIQKTSGDKPTYFRVNVSE